MSRFYRLNANGEPIACASIAEWCAPSLTEQDYRVALDKIGDDVEVSTVFTGINSNYSEGPPILWETMVFGGKHDREYDRCAGSREQAQAMHAKMLERITAAEKTG